jgi:hypothetical protein
LTRFGEAMSAINAVADQLGKVVKPYAGARIRAAILRDGFSRFLTGSVIFSPEEVHPRPSASYGTLLFVEQWENTQNGALNWLSRLLSGQGEISGEKIGSGFRQSDFEHRPFTFGSRGWSGWEMRSLYDEHDIYHDQPLNYGAVLGFGLRPYLGAEQAINDWVFDTVTDKNSNAVPYLHELLTFLPDTRARFVSALWTPGKLSLGIEVNAPSKDIELQIIHAGSARLPQTIHAISEAFELETPDDARELLLYLMHRSGNCIMHIHLRSVYESFGQVPEDLIAKSRAESDLGKGEGDQIEFKPFISPNNPKETEIVDTVIAFANTLGGRIYVGVKDRDASPQGVKELLKTFRGSGNKALTAQAERLRWLITNRIVPTPRFRIEENRAFDHPIVTITVERSSTIHYERGSNEVWVRRGGSNERPKPG